MSAATSMQALLAIVDEVVLDVQVRERFGDVGPALSPVLGSWCEPLTAAMRTMAPTAQSQAAARAVTELARLTGAFAGEAVQSIAGWQADPPDAGPTERYAALARRIDDSFLDFSSSPEFERARRCAAAAVLDWLEHDRATASRIARALEPPPEHPVAQSGDSTSVDTEAVPCDGTATLNAYPAVTRSRAGMVVVPGFTTGVRVFDLDPQHSTARSLAEHGVDTWVLDWGRPDEADRLRTVANQLERIDRAVDAVRQRMKGRRPALAGHFHGGLLALLYCIRHPGKISALVTLSTPVEFASSDDAFANWLRACNGERLVEVFGNVPGPLVASLVAAVSPMRWCGGGFFTLLDSLGSTAAARIARFERARRFPPAFPGETFRGLYRAFYRDNAFAANGGAVIDGYRYDLADLATPLLNIFARDDRIVPSGASIPLEQWAEAAPGSRRECRGGHFDLLAGQDAHRELPSEIAAWLMAHTPDA